MSSTRRDFLKRGAALSGLALLDLSAVSGGFAQGAKSPNQRPVIAAIGVGGMGSGNARRCMSWGDLAAICDVDAKRLRKANQDFRDGQAAAFGDYRKLLERKDIDVVIISTPDHWHAKMAADAMRAGKDVYVEKPMTLTIDEGRILGRVVKETGRVLQVGSQQRSENRLYFQKAVAMVRDGRLGRIRRVTCAIPGGKKGGPFKKSAPPAELDWDLWLGQAPKVEYIKERCHYDFRFWLETAGGRLTDWGAHHVDIAQWAIGAENSGPTTIEPVAVEMPTAYEKGYAKADDCFNAPYHFHLRCTFAGGVEIDIRDGAKELGFSNGIQIVGEKGTIFVARDKFSGPLVDELKDKPLPAELLTELRKGAKPGPHMGNFFDCCQTRKLPISDVFTTHRTISTCHLGNLAARLGRKLTWDPAKERFVNDAEADTFIAREQRQGFELT